MHRYPLPSLEQQPSNNPLLHPASIASIYDAGIISIARCVECHSRSFTLAPSLQSGHFKIDKKAALIFADRPNANQSGEQSSWYTLEMELPFIKKVVLDDGWDFTAALRPSASTPLFVVHHELTVNMTCSYTFPDTNEVSVERLSFTVLPSFGHIAPPPPQSILPLSISSDDDCSVPSLPVVGAYAPVLPIYSQLYDMDGNVKVDYSVPLPLYTRPENTFYGRQEEMMDRTSELDSHRWKDDIRRCSDEVSPPLRTSAAELVSSQ